MLKFILRSKLIVTKENWIPLIYNEMFMEDKEISIKHNSQKYWWHHCKLKVSLYEIILLVTSGSWQWPFWELGSYKMRSFIPPGVSAYSATREEGSLRGNTLVVPLEGPDKVSKWKVCDLRCPRDIVQWA